MLDFVLMNCQINHLLCSNIGFNMRNHSEKFDGITTVTKPLIPEAPIFRFSTCLPLVSILY